LVRLSAGRQQMSDELQALCFLAGANSIFYGDKLLTAGNPEAGRDEALFARLGLHRRLTRIMRSDFSRARPNPTIPPQFSPAKWALAWEHDSTW
jgi:biotin synthase-like enzyme